MGVEGEGGEGKEWESFLAWGLWGGVGRHLVEEGSRSFFGGSAGFASLLIIFGGTLRNFLN